MKIVEYEKKYGEICFPKGFELILKGLSVEEQITYFRTSSCKEHSEMRYDSRTMERGYTRLKDDSKVAGVIVKDGMIVGMMIHDAWKRVMPCLAEEYICTCYDFDDDDEEIVEYTWLLCVPVGFER